MALDTIHTDDERAIEEVLYRFDCEIVEKTAQMLEWYWTDNGDTFLPDQRTILRRARSLCEQVCALYRRKLEEDGEAGAICLVEYGIRAIRDDTLLTLEFIVTEADAIAGEAAGRCDLCKRDVAFDSLCPTCKKWICDWCEHTHND
jgi:hypothetical protein